MQNMFRLMMWIFLSELFIRCIRDLYVAAYQKESFIFNGFRHFFEHLYVLYAVFQTHTIRKEYMKKNKTRVLARVIRIKTTYKTYKTYKCICNA